MVKDQEKRREQEHRKGLSSLLLFCAFRNFYPINYNTDLKIVTFYWYTVYCREIECERNVGLNAFVFVTLSRNVQIV
jgi:hypothetical protein